MTLPKEDFQLCSCKYSPGWLTFPLLEARVTLLHRYRAINTHIYTHSHTHTYPYTKSQMSTCTHTLDMYHILLAHDTIYPFGTCIHHTQIPCTYHPVHTTSLFILEVFSTEATPFFSFLSKPKFFSVAILYLVGVWTQTQDLIFTISFPV